MAHGAGRLKDGENGRGIRSRWYPETLATRIRNISHIRDRLSFIHGDGLQTIVDNSSLPDIVFFVDPPYTASGKKPGKRLYDCADLNHTRLFELLAQSSGEFLMTYDNVEEVKLLAQAFNFDYLAIPMKNTHHAKLNELLIGRNLDWARS
jgi:DNA adenine methylase